jgi:hypothetical protein
MDLGQTAYIYIKIMARLSVGGANAPDPTAINLTRLLARLQKTLLQPDTATEQRLRGSSYERSRVDAVKLPITSSRNVQMANKEYLCRISTMHEHYSYGSSKKLPPSKSSPKSKKRRQSCSKSET